MCVTSDKSGSPSRRRRIIPVVQNNRRVAGDWNHSHEMQHFTNQTDNNTVKASFNFTNQTDNNTVKASFNFTNQTDNNTVKASFNLCLTCYSFRTWGWLCRKFHTHTHTHTQEVGLLWTKSTDIKHIYKTKQTLHLCQQLWILLL